MFIKQSIIKIQNYCLLIIHFFACLKCEIPFIDNALKTNHLIAAIRDVIGEVKPYQIVFFIENQTNISIYNTGKVNIDSVIRKVLTKKTTIIIEKSMFQNFTIYVNPQRSLLYNARHTTLFVSFLQANVENENLRNLLFRNANEVLEFIISLTPRRARPYCMFVIETKMQINEKIIEDVLRASWRRNFLDTTVFEVTSENYRCANNLISHYYNPFFGSFYNDCYSSHIRTFPNKMLNMNQYPLIISMLRRPPEVDFELNARGEPINMNGSDYGCVRIMASVMNFSIIWVSFPVKSYNEPIPHMGETTVMDLIIRGKIEFSGNQIYTHLALTGNERHGERSMVLWVDQLSALVPVYHSCVVSNNVIRIMLMIIVHIGFVYLLAKVFKFKARCWLPHDILRILLISTSSTLPTRIAERIFLMSLILGSLQYTVDLYARLTDNNLLLHGQGPFHNFRDLEKSNLIFEIHPNHLNMTFSDRNVAHSGLKNKTKLVKDILNCPTRLLTDHRVACLMDKSAAKRAVINDSRYHQPWMKVMEPPFWSAPKGCVFSEASPYVIEFNRIMRHVYESSLFMRWFIHHKQKRKHILSSEDNFGDGSDILLRNKLYVVCFFGCLLSTVAFISEHIVNYLNGLLYKKNKLVKRRLVVIEG